MLPQPNLLLLLLLFLAFCRSILVAESFTGGQVSFVEDASVGSAVWEPLEKLYNGEVSERNN
jgi:hypothetical protein